MIPDSRVMSLAKWFRSLVSDTLTGERYVSKIAITSKGNTWFQIIEPDGSYIVHVKKIDPETM